MDRNFREWLVGMSATMNNAMIIGFAWVVYMMTPNQNIERLLLLLIVIAGILPPIFYLYFRFVYSRKSFRAKLRKARKRRRGRWAARIATAASIAVVVGVTAYTYHLRGVTAAAAIGVALVANQWYARLTGSNGR